MATKVSLLVVVVFVLVFNGIMIQSFPNGAPLQACRDLIPHHPWPVTTGLVPYNIIVNPVESNGKNVRLKIFVSGSGADASQGISTIAGFLIQVRDEITGRFVGKLSNVEGTSKYACGSRAAVTHTDNGQKATNSLQFEWEPLPGELQSPVNVRVYATFVKTAAKYWTPIASNLILISP